MLNPSWIKWCINSPRNYFGNALLSTGIYFYVESSGNKKTNIKDCFEFRIGGPYINQYGQNDYKLAVDINILIQVSLDYPDKDRIFKLSGIVADSFKPVIPLFAYGNETTDDPDQTNPTQITCMQLTEYNDWLVRINHYGQINPSINQAQSTVEGRYVVRLP